MYWNGNINWLSSGDLNRGIVNHTMEKITEEGQKASNKTNTNDDDEECDIYSYLGKIPGNAEIHFDKFLISTKKQKDDFISFNIYNGMSAYITLDMDRIFEGNTTFHVISSLDDVKKMVDEWFIKYDDCVKQRLDKKKTELSEIKFQKYAHGNYQAINTAIDYLVDNDLKYFYDLYKSNECYNNRLVSDQEFKYYFRKVWNKQRSICNLSSTILGYY